MDRTCPHGQLQRSCVTCEDAQTITSIRTELTTAKAEIERLKAEIEQVRENHNAVIVMYLRAQDDLDARASSAEAELATAIARADAAELARDGLRKRIDDYLQAKDAFVAAARDPRCTGEAFFGPRNVMFTAETSLRAATRMDRVAAANEIATAALAHQPAEPPS